MSNWLERMARRASGEQRVSRRQLGRSGLPRMPRLDARVDAAARRLAGPISRRQMVVGTAATAGVLSVGGIWPRPAWALCSDNQECIDNGDPLATCCPYREYGECCRTETPPVNGHPDINGEVCMEGFGCCPADRACPGECCGSTEPDTSWTCARDKQGAQVCCNHPTDPDAPDPGERFCYSENPGQGLCCAEDELCVEDPPYGEGNFRCECLPGRAECGDVCCPPGQVCDSATTTCQCAQGQETCGSTCCAVGTFCCDADQGLCCTTGAGCCSESSGAFCCEDPNSCARAALPGDGGGIREGAPTVCCPPDRYVESFGSCCPPGELVTTPGALPACCPSDRLTSDRKCCAFETSFACGDHCCGTAGASNPAAIECCGGSCKSTDWSPAHCGGCGKACRSGTICVRGRCTQPVPDVGQHGDVTTKAGCGGPGTCTGSAEMTISGAGRGRLLRFTPRRAYAKAPAVLGSTDFKIPAGETRKIKVRLSGEGKRVLKRERRVRAVLALKLKDGGKTRTAESEPFKLRA